MMMMMVEMVVVVRTSSISAVKRLDLAEDLGDLLVLSPGCA